MGFMKTPKLEKDPELEKQREAEKQRLAAEQAEFESKRIDRNRKIAGNLLGSKSLQDEDMQGFTGFRRKNMGGNDYA